MMKAVIYLVIIFSASELLAGTKLKGIVYDENSSAVRNITLRFSTLGSAVTTNSGEFIFELPDGVQTVEIELPDRIYSILYPVDKRIAAPVDPDYIFKIVITKNNSSGDIKELAEKYVKLEHILADIGVAQNELKTLLADFIKKESEEKNLEEDNLRAAIYKEKRNERFAVISSAFLKYTLKLENVKNGLKVIRDFSFNNGTAYNEFAENVVQYNLIFNELNNNRFAFRSDVALFWDNKILADEVFDVIKFSLNEIHEPFILNLNDEITEMNKLFASYYDDDETRDDVKKNISGSINAAIIGIEQKIPQLKNKIDDVLIKLQDNI